MSSFKERIKELRNQYEMTQKEFSEYLGIRQQTLSGYERGTSSPSLEVAQNIADKCHVSIDWLCGKSYTSPLLSPPATYGQVGNLIVDIGEAVNLKSYFGNQYGFHTGSKIINKFVGQFITMRNLEKSNVITNEMYLSWLQGELSQLDMYRLDDEELRKLDKFAPSLPDSEDSE